MCVACSVVPYATQPLASAAAGELQIDVQVALQSFKAAQEACNKALCEKRGWEHVLTATDYYVSHTTSYKWSQQVSRNPQPLHRQVM